MKDEYVSFETAKIAKEKGFDEKTIDWYSEKGELINLYYAWTWNTNKGNRDDFVCSAPTQSLLQRWLREVHEMQAEVHSYHRGESGYTYYEVVTGKCGEGFITTSNFKTYEEALEHGLQKALELI